MTAICSAVKASFWGWGGSCPFPFSSLESQLQVHHLESLLWVPLQAHGIKVTCSHGGRKDVAVFVFGGGHFPTQWEAQFQGPSAVLGKPPPKFKALSLNTALLSQCFSPLKPPPLHRVTSWRA